MAQQLKVYRQRNGSVRFELRNGSGHYAVAYANQTGIPDAPSEEDFDAISAVIDAMSQEEFAALCATAEEDAEDEE